MYYSKAYIYILMNKKDTIDIINSKIGSVCASQFLNYGPQIKRHLYTHKVVRVMILNKERP